MDSQDSTQLSEKQHRFPPPSYGESEVEPGVAPVPGAAPVAGVMYTTHTVTTMNNIAPVGPKPAQIVCSSCNATVVTRVDHKSTTKTHLIALLLCLCLCWPCVCVPYCTDSCMNADHYCPNCNSYLGTYAH